MGLMAGKVAEEAPMASEEEEEEALGVVDLVS